MRNLTLPTIDDCPRAGRDTFLIGTMPEFAARADKVPHDFSSRRDCTSGSSWHGNVSYDVAVQDTRTGDLSGVPASDAFLAKFEDLAPSRPAWPSAAGDTGQTPGTWRQSAGWPPCPRGSPRQA